MVEFSLQLPTLPFTPRPSPRLRVVPIVSTVLMWSICAVVGLLYPLHHFEMDAWLGVYFLSSLLMTGLRWPLTNSKWTLYDDRFEITVGWKREVVLYQDIFRLECDAHNDKFLRLKCRFRTPRPWLEFLVGDEEYPQLELAQAVLLLKLQVPEMELTETAKDCLRQWMTRN